MRLPSLRARWVGLLALGLAVAGGSLALRRFDSVVLPRLELALLDARFEIRGAVKPPSRVVIVAFDEKAQVAIGRFPIPRIVQARLLNAIAAEGPRLVIEDFAFEQPSANPNDDNALILALRRAAPVVVATSAVDAQGRSPALGGPSGQAAARATPGYSGFATSPGGVFRRVRHDVEGLPTTAVAAARLLGHPAPAAAFPKGGAWIDYVGPPGTIPTISAADVLNGRMPRFALHDRIVIIGDTTPDSQDVHATPFANDGLMSGPEVQANALITVLRGNPLRDLPALVDDVVIVVAALLTPMLALRLSLVRALVLAVIALAVVLVGSQLLFDAGWILAVGAAALSLATSAVATVPVEYVGAKRERDRLRKLFAAQQEELVDAVLGGVSSKRSPALAPTEIVGGYKLERVIGRGGMGVVYLATQLNLERSVALKLMGPELATEPGYRDRFIRESRAAAAIEHPNVIPVYEAGEDDGLLFIAMRYVDGCDLVARMTEHGPLMGVEVADLSSQLGAALDAAHGRGLVHRDVKPANVLLASGGSHLYLTDFGVATSSGALTRTGTFVGTARYVAPEQIEGKPVDGRADIYSLACVLYEALTGRTPFAGRDIRVLWAHVNEEPEPPSRWRASLSVDVDAILLRALAKDPAARPPTAGEFSSHLASTLTAVESNVGDAQTELVTGLEDEALELGDDSPTIAEPET